MAYSTQRAVSDGTMVYLDLAIGYQSRADIKVFMNDLPAAEGSWAWVGTTDKRISFTPAVPNGVEVLVQRTTRLDRIINLFTLGAKFNNTTMDMNFQQVLYLTQEAVEGSALSDIYNDVDFHGYKVKNLGLAVDDTDAITFGQVKSFGTGAYAAQLAAEAARDRAAQWAAQLTTPVEGGDFSAKQYALNASDSATAAAGSASAASGSASAAAGSASASQTSRLASEAARDLSIAARDDAQAAAAPATALIARVDAVEDVADAATATAASAVSTAGAALTAAAVATVGQCRFVYTSSSVCTLLPFNGRNLLINGVVRTLPLAGVTVTNAGLTISTRQYVYAYWTGSAIALEASTTGPATHTDGVRIKSGDSTRSLVGMLYVGSDGAFRDNDIDRHVASYFNRRVRNVAGNLGSSIGIPTSSALVGSGLSTLVWSDSYISSTLSGTVTGPTANTVVQASVAWNSGGVGTAGLYQLHANAAQGQLVAHAAADNPAAAGFAEGLVTLRANAVASAGGAAFYNLFLFTQTQI